MGQWMNETSFICPKEINSYITNLTSSYTEKSNEPNMVAASVIMFVLAGLFFNLNLFSGISDVSAILDPKVRLFLYSALSLFLPVMSYLFSEAKNAGGAAVAVVAATTTTTAHAAAADLSLRAGLILAWMLLVELLRKKVDEIRMRGYSGTIQRAGRVAWLGNLVFFNIKTAGRKAVFSVLWILCATKVLQRIAFTEVGKRSYAHGKNARLISSYMSQILLGDDHRPHQEITGKELLKTCSYIVMGEENLEDIEPTADGYKLLEDNKSTTSYADDNHHNKIRKFLKDRGIVTVGEVWQLVEGSKLFTSPEQTESLRRICLSFALFKLLRRRFEHLPAMTDKEVRDSRDLILRGLYRHNKDGDDGDNPSCSPEAVFLVMNDEINFLSEYYHSVIPVVLASPFFLFINYILLTVAVAVLCLMAVILCGNGDVMYAFHSIAADNYTLQSGLSKIAICLVIRAIRSPAAFFSIVDLSITGLLFVIFFYEEIWEFLVFVLSNWFMVSLLYNYIIHWRDSPNPTTTFPFALRGIIWLRSKMSHRRLSMKQFSVLNLRWPLKVPLFATFTSMAVRTEVVPRKVMEGIMKYLDATHHDAVVPTKGMSALGRHQDLPLPELSWACQSSSVAEVILTWHIATSIMEVEGVAPQNDSVEVASSKVAIRLSKYCAYLVAFHPELLPDNPDKAERVFADMKVELMDMIGYWHYYILSQRKRAKKIFQVKDQEMITSPGGDHQATTAAGGRQSDDRKYRVVHDGVNLARSLMKFQAKRWKVLADVWNELIIYVAPSSDEERVRGHEDVLVQGGEFITVLWALTTHIGVSRKPRQTTADSNDAARTTAAAENVVHLDV